MMDTKFPSRVGAGVLKLVGEEVHQQCVVPFTVQSLLDPVGMPVPPPVPQGLRPLSARRPARIAPGTGQPGHGAACWLLD
jgi:hypothetical protein